MLEEIDNGFRINLARVRALVDVYQERAGAGPGRRAVETADLLRAAVVFLHATMEDVLRSVLEWKWPQTTSRQLLEGVPFVGATVDHRGANALRDDLCSTGGAEP